MSTKTQEDSNPIRKNIEVVRCYGGYRCEIHVGKEIFAHATLSFTKEKAEARRQQILSQAIQTTADDLDEADHRARGMQQELADVLGATSPLTWPQLLGLVETLRLQVEHKQKVEHIIETLRGMDTLSDIVDQVRLQLSDEAVVEHLKTCAQALDEQHHKYILMDAAELLTDLFCSEES
jgi:hypothetical protein